MTSVYAHLEKPSMVDYPQHLAAVFFTSGCGFNCGYCHNASLMGTRQKGLTEEELRRICRNFQGQWVNGVVISGGEPTMAPDLLDLIHLFRSFGFSVKLDTNGSNPDRLAQCLPYVDYVAMDIKASFTHYPTIAGYNETNKIERSVDLIKRHARDYEFRTTIIESVHSDDHMDELQTIVEGAKRYILQPFVPRENLPDENYRCFPRTSANRLKQIKDRMQGCVDELLLRGV